MQCNLKYQGFFMSNTLVKDTQTLTTPTLQSLTKYLIRALSMQRNLKSQGFFMSNTLVKDTQPLTTPIPQL